MTRKDFILVANTIRSLELEAPHKDAIAQAFRVALESHHPFFDGQKFIEASTGYYDQSEIKGEN
jgi:hypothetical protein